MTQDDYSIIFPHTVVMPEAAAYLAVDGVDGGAPRVMGVRLPPSNDIMDRYTSSRLHINRQMVTQQRCTEHW
jgi:hypothetical protein